MSKAVLTNGDASDIEHVAIRNGAFGESDIEGKAAMGSGENGAAGTPAT
jgi:hypothetical protein